MAETGQATRKQVDVKDILANSTMQQQAIADGMSVFTFFDRNMGTHITIATDLTANDPRLGTREGLLDYVLSNAGDQSKVRVFRPDRDYSYAESELPSIAWDAQPSYMFERIVRSTPQEDLEQARRGGVQAIASLRPDQMDAFRQMLNDYLGQAPARTPEMMIGMSWEDYAGGMSLSTRMTEAGPVLTFASEAPRYSMEIQFKDATAAQEFVADLNRERVGGDVQQQAIWDLDALRAVIGRTPSADITKIQNAELGGSTMNFGVELTREELLDSIDRFLLRHR